MNFDAENDKKQLIRDTVICDYCGYLKPDHEKRCIHSLKNSKNSDDPQLIENETLSTTVDLMRSIIDKLLNIGKPTYSEAELIIINDSIKRHMKGIPGFYPCGIELGNGDWVKQKDLKKELGIEL